MYAAEFVQLNERLDRIEAELKRVAGQAAEKEWYGTDEAAGLLCKAEFTVREWCRQGRIAARKKQSGRGRHLAWVISAAEIARYQREGLRPISDAADRGRRGGVSSVAGKG